jgi:molybdenum cofactor cytidylyltransferase
MTGKAGPASSGVAGVVLAAGAGLRYGGPKALARQADGTSWLLHAVQTLEQAGCCPVIIVLGAGATEAEDLVQPHEDRLVVRALDAAQGLSASLRTGLHRADALPADIVAVMIVPVDVPDLNVQTVLRLLSPRSDTTLASDSLRQATFEGRPGHPVFIGRQHWPALEQSLQGDVGARPYLIEHRALPVECGDLSSGLDVDF